MISRSIVLPLLAFVVMTLGTTVLAQEQPGTPPMTVIPVPTPSDEVDPPTTVDPNDNSSGPASTTITVPPVSTTPEGGDTAGADVVANNPTTWRVIVATFAALVVLTTASTALIRKRRSRRATEPIADVDPREHTQYELLAFVFENGKSDDFGLRILSKGLFAKLDDAVDSARSERSGWPAQSGRRRVWWVVVSALTGTTIQVLRPHVPGSADNDLSRLERLLEDLHALLGAEFVDGSQRDRPVTVAAAAADYSGSFDG